MFKLLTATMLAALLAGSFYGGRVPTADATEQQLIKWPSLIESRTFARAHRRGLNLIDELRRPLAKWAGRIFGAECFARSIKGPREELPGACARGGRPEEAWRLEAPVQPMRQTELRG